MSERIDVRADITIAGAAANAVRGEQAARTQRVAAEPAGPAPAGALAYCASGALMSERIDVRVDITIAGAAGDAVRGGLAARTRRVAAELAGHVPAGALAYCASGGAEECAANNGIRESRTTIFARTHRAPPP